MANADNKTTVIEYRFRMESAEDKVFVVHLRPGDMGLVMDPEAKAPEWTRLENCQCPNCPLRAGEVAHCPAALGMSELMDSFKDCLSTDPADITVAVESREYRRRAPLQYGVSALMGLIMATSGCPVTEKLRPMVHVHLPFATIGETMYRAASMYLLAQFFRQNRGMEPDWQMENLVQIFEEVAEVNQSFARRLISINPKDASLNALANLDCFAMVTSFSITKDKLKELEPLFGAYLQ
ncbi:MAG: hypothetical protein RI897_388 [Verrucomicrobiota bacterium]|jgi:hypothetical protein